MRKIKKFLFTIMLFLVGGSCTIFSACQLTAYEKVEFDLSETSLTLTKSGYAEGESKTVSAVISKAKGDISKKVTFISSNPEVAYVESVQYEDGTTSAKIVAVSGGDAIVYAIAEGNIKKTINVSVSQEAQSISINSAYTPLIVKGQTFRIDESQIVVLPATATDKSYSALLYKGSEVTSASQAITTVMNPLNLSGTETSALDEGNYVLRVTKQTSKGTIYADLKIVVKQPIDASKITLEDLDGNSLEVQEGSESKNFTLATNANPSQTENLTSKKFRVLYNDSADLSAFSVSTNQQTNSFSIVPMLDITGGVSYYTIWASQKVDATSFAVALTYAGFEQFSTPVEKSYSVKIDTYPEQIGYKIGNAASFSEINNFQANIYSSQYTDITFSNLPVDSTYNQLILRLTSSGSYGINSPFEDIKVNGTSVSLSSLGSGITIESGSVVSFLAKDDYTGSVLSFEVYNKDFSALRENFSLRVQKAVLIDRFYVEDINGNFSMSSIATVIVGQEKTIYFTFNVDDNPYFEALNFRPSADNLEIVSLEITEIELSGTPTVVGKVVVYVSGVTENSNETIQAKNGEVIMYNHEYKIYTIRAVVPISFQNVSQTIPEIYLEAENAKRQANISALTTNLNSKDVEAISINANIGQNTEKGKVALDLVAYPSNATISVSASGINVKKILEAGEQPAGETELVAVYNTETKQLELQVGDDGWDANYVVSMKVYYYNNNASYTSVTKTFSVQTYRKLKFGDISIKSNNKDVSRIDLIDSTTTGDAFTKSYARLDLSISNLSQVSLPEVDITLSGGGNKSSFKYHNVVYNIVSGARLSLVYFQTTQGNFEFYVLAKSIGDVQRYGEYVFVTVKQDNTTFNKLVEVIVTKQSVASEISVQGYQTDDDGVKYYVLKSGETLALNNYVLPRDVQTGIGYEVKNGFAGEYFTVENNRIISLGAGDDATLKIYPQSKKTFTEEAWIDFISGKRSEIMFNAISESDCEKIIVRCENGTADFPFSIFRVEDFKNKFKNGTNSSNQTHYELMKDIVATNYLGSGMSWGPEGVKNYRCIIDSMSYSNINGNNHTLRLSNNDYFIRAFYCGKIENLKFISDYALCYDFNSSSLINCEITSSYSYVVNDGQFVKVNNCTFYRDHRFGDEKYFAGIMLSTTNSPKFNNNRIIINTNLMRGDYQEGFAGIVISLGTSGGVLNNRIEFIGNGDIDFGESGYGGLLVRSTSERSRIMDNSVISYCENDINRNGTLSGLLYNIAGTTVENNSVFANVKGPALIKRINTSSPNNFVGEVKNNVFIGDCGENGFFIESVNLNTSRVQSIINNVFYNKSGTASIFENNNGLFYNHSAGFARPLTKVEGKTYLYTDTSGSKYYVDQENDIYFFDNDADEIKDANESAISKMRILNSNTQYYNFFVLDNTVIENPSFTGNTGVVRLNSDGFKNKANFQVQNAETGLYYGLAFDVGNYAPATPWENTTYINSKVWAMGPNYPMLYGTDGAVVDLIAPSSMTFENKGLSNIVADEANDAYLIKGVEKGSLLDLNDYFTLRLDGATAKLGSEFGFEIQEADGLEKVSSSTLSLNKYGFARIRVYALSNPSLEQELILFVYGDEGVQVTNRNAEAIISGSIINIREGETFEFNALPTSSLEVVVRVDEAEAFGVNGKYIIETAGKDEIEIEVSYAIRFGGVVYNFNISQCAFQVKTYKGATAVSMSFSDSSTFSKQDSVFASLSITTDRGEISVNEFRNLINVAGTQLPELSLDVLSSSASTETVLGVVYTTTTFELKFYFADVLNLIDYSNEINDAGVYVISLSIDDISFEEFLNLSAQEVQAVEYVNVLSPTSEFSQQLINDLQNRSQNYITPGGSSMLDIYVYPLYADFDEVRLTSNTIVNSRGQNVAIVFEQRILSGDSYVVNTSSENVSVQNGIKLLRKSNHDSSFNGHFYVRNILASDEAYYLVNGSEFQLTLSFIRDGEVVREDVLTLIVEVVPTVEFNAPSYAVAGIEFNATLECNENINAGLKFSISGNETLTRKLQKYISVRELSRVYVQSVWRTTVGIIVDYRLLLDDDFENFNGEIAVNAAVTKQIRGISYTHTQTHTFKLMKWMIESIEVKNAKDVYLSNQTINLAYSINPVYFEDGFAVTPKEIDYIESVKEEIQALENEINSNLKLDGFINYVGYGQTWKFYQNGDGTEYNRIVPLVYNDNINFRANFTFDYSGLTPVLPGSEQGAQWLQIVSAKLNSYINLVSDEDNPDPIRNLEDFYNMRPGIHYRLLTNLKLSSWVPMDLDVASFDGNGYIIYIDSFNVDLEDDGDVNLGFLNSIAPNTIVKNVTLGINSNISSFNIENASSFNFGGFVVVNEGSIYNCEVISMSLANYANDFEPAPLLMAQSNITNDAYVGNLNFVVSTALAKNTTVGGFVAYNRGNIVNSRLGRSTDSFVYGANNQSEKTGVGHYGTEPEDKFSEFVVGGNGFNISSSGTIAGFAAENDSNGIIASSYAANVGIGNGSTDENTGRTAGFIVRNAGQINGCYVAGQKNGSDVISATKSLIWSPVHVAGFVFENFGEITDSLSNIKTMTNALSAGFAYKNSSNSLISECVSLSKNAQSRINSPFVGHDGIESYQKGETKNCYYFDEDKQIYKSTKDNSARVIVSTLELADESNFNGYSFNSEDFASGIWFMTEEGYPTLTSANEIAVSNFKLNESASVGSEYVYTELTENKNPVTIDSAFAWHKKMLNRLSHDDDPTRITGNYRLINNIDFAEIGVQSNVSAQANLTYFYDFTGKLDGNGLRINSLSVSTSEAMNSLGLFSSINKYDVQNSIVKNLTIRFVKSASQDATTETIAAANVKSVGGLAGLINNAKIYKINLLGDYSVYGSYFAGGLAGIVVGENTEINNIYSELSAKIANYGNLSALDVASLDKSKIIDNNNNIIVTATGISTGNLKGFVGGIAGFVDIGQEISSKTNITSANVANVSKIVGTYAGGVFGFVGKNTNMHEIGFEINAFRASASRSKNNIVGYQVMGGVIAINKGILRYGYVEHQNQKDLDAVIYDSTLINSEINLFRTDSSVYKNIASENKDIYVGGLVGINVYGTKQLDEYDVIETGVIRDSISKVAVIPADLDETHLNQETDAVKLTTYAGGMIGWALGGVIETSYTTAQVIANFSGGVVGRVSADIYFENVIALTSYVTGISGMSLLNTNAVAQHVYYPESFYNTNLPTYYAKSAEAESYHIGAFISLLDDESINVYKNSITSVGVENLIYVNKIANIEADIRFIGFVNDGNEIVAFDNSAIEPTSMIDNGHIKQVVARDVAFNAIEYFADFKGISVADWVIAETGGAKILPYPNFGILLSKTIETAEDFLEVKLQSSLNYSVVPSSNSYTITLVDWIASANAFTGSLIGVGRGDDEDNLEYPTIRVWLNNDQQFNSIFETIRGAIIKNLNLEIYVNTVNDSSEIYFGALASKAFNSKIENVNVKVISNGEAISFSVGNVVQSNGYIDVSKIQYFGGVVGYSENTLISGCDVELKVESNGTIDGDNIFGGIAAQVKGGRIVGNNATIEEQSTDFYDWCKIFGGIVGEALDNDSVYRIENNTASAIICADSTNPQRIGGIVGINRANSKLIQNKFEITVNSDNCLYGNGDNATGLVFGGIAAENYGSIEECYSYLKIDISEKYVVFGGTVGLNYGTVENCEAQFYGFGVSIGSINATVGGIAGISEDGFISSCFTNLKAVIQENGAVVGGIAGKIKATTENSGIYECFANINIVIVDLELDSVNAGGLVGIAIGENTSIMANIVDCYVAGAIVFGNEAAGILGTIRAGGVVGSATFAKLQNVYSVCDISNENQMRATSSEDAKIGLIMGVNSNYIEIYNVFAIRECNMELPSGTQGNADVVFIGEFWQEYNNAVTWNTETWQIENTKLPTLASINLPEHENASVYAHAEGSRICPTVIDDSKSSNCSLSQNENAVIVSGNNVKLNSQDNVMITYNAWLVSNRNVNNKEVELWMNLGSKGVVSGFMGDSFNNSVAQNSYGKITYCDIELKSQNNPIIKTIFGGYYEHINILINVICRGGYFANSINAEDYVLIKDITVNSNGGAAQGAFVKTVYGGTRTVFENIALNVTVGSPSDSASALIGTVSSGNIVVNKTYNTGYVSTSSNGAPTLGGLIGLVNNGNLEIKNSFNAGFINNYKQSNAYASVGIGGIIGRWSGGTITMEDVYSASMKKNEDGNYPNPVHGIIGVCNANSENIANSSFENVYFARDLIFNDLYDNEGGTEFGLACDYAELSEIFANLGWEQGNFTLPYIEGMNIPEQGGSLFKPTLYNGTGNLSGKIDEVKLLQTNASGISSIDASGFRGVLLGNNAAITLTNKSMFSSLGSAARIIGFNLHVKDINRHKTEDNNVQTTFGAVISSLTDKSLYLNNVQVKIDGTIIDETNGSQVGGFVGSISTQQNPAGAPKLVVYNSSTTGVIEAKWINTMGGMIGNVSAGTAEINQSYSTLRFNISDCDYVGGIIGVIANTSIAASIKNSYYAGVIRAETADDVVMAGLVANANANVTVTNCYDAGSIFVGTELKSSSVAVGGSGTITSTNLVEKANLWTSSETFANFGASTNLFEETTTKTWVWWNTNYNNILPTLAWQYNAGGADNNKNFVYNVEADSSQRLSLNASAEFHEQIGVIKIADNNYSSSVNLTKNYNGNNFPIVLHDCVLFNEIGVSGLDSITISNLTLIIGNNTASTGFLGGNYLSDDGEGVLSKLIIDSIFVGGISVNANLSGANGVLIDDVAYESNPSYIRPQVTMKGYNINLVSICDTVLEDYPLSSNIGGFFGVTGDLIIDGKVINYGNITGSAAGGFVGDADKLSLNAHSENHGVINGSYAGGFVGEAGDLILNADSENYGVITGAYAAGGFVGFASTIQIYNGTKINYGEVNGQYAGGFAGEADNAVFMKTNTDYPVSDGIVNTNRGDITGHFAGGLVGYLGNDTEIYSGYNANDGAIRGSYAAGGLIAHADSLQIINGENINNGFVEGNTVTGGLFGGCSDLIISGGTNTNNASISPNGDAGGLVGKVTSNFTIENGTNTNYGNITASEHAGGFVGYVGADLTISGGTNVNYGDVTATNGIAGGFVGYVAYSVAISGNNTNTGNVSATGDAGGFVGYVGADLTILGGTNVNYGDVTATNGIAGGFVGYVGADLTILGGTNTNGDNSVSAENQTVIISSRIIPLVDTAFDEVQSAAGGIIGFAVGTFEINSQDCNIYNYANIMGNDASGGIIGTAKELKNNNGNILNKGNISGVRAGGLAGVICKQTGEFIGGDIIINGGTNKNQGTINATLHGGGLSGVAVRLYINGGTNENQGTINATYTSNETTGYAGGFVGSVRSTVEITGGTNTNNGTINSSDGHAGGFVGTNYDGGELKISGGTNLNAGNVSATNGIAGGFVGYVAYSVTISGNNNTNTGNVSATGDAGGFVGKTEGILTLSGNNTNGEANTTKGSITSSNGDAGGFVGYVGDDLTISGGTNVNYGSVRGYYHAGGFAGYVEGNFTIESGTNINYGSIEATDTSSNSTGYAGGFVGSLFYSVYINDGYNVNDGYVTGQYAGGVFGFSEDSFFIIGGLILNTGAIDGSLYAGGFAGYIGDSADDEFLVTGGSGEDLGAAQYYGGISGTFTDNGYLT